MSVESAFQFSMLSSTPVVITPAMLLMPASSDTNTPCRRKGGGGDAHSEG